MVQSLDDYIKKLTDVEEVQESYIDDEEREGISSLKKRVAEAEIVIFSTDKSGRFVLLTMENYRYAGG